MANPQGFLKTTERETPARRPVSLRLMDWREVYELRDGETTRRQAGRCMDCGVPFCHGGCPLGNLIPEWNDLVRRGEGRAAIERLHATNNFPEFTGALCPAPCEAACVLGINQPAVTIKEVEASIIEHAFEEGWVVPEPPARLTGKTVAVVGSGPAGLAAAQQLTRAGHTVAVYEREDRIGGLLRYGIPDFKMEKYRLDRRLEQMEAEGTRFRPGVEIGVDLGWGDLRRRFDAVVIATGATVPRDLPIPGRELAGVHFAMDLLVPANRAAAAEREASARVTSPEDESAPEFDSSSASAASAEPGEQAPPSAAGRHVVVLGGGDTGADCIGTAHRQGALSVTNLAIGTRPGTVRPTGQPWPTMPTLFEVQSAHEEGGTREYLVSTVRFNGDEHGNVCSITVAETRLREGRREPTPGTEREIPADLVLLALGFTGAETESPAGDLGIGVDEQGNLDRNKDYGTSSPGVFVVGDAGRGQSLIVWAIAEGRAAAAAVDRFLEGGSALPHPVHAHERALALPGAPRNPVRGPAAAEHGVTQNETS